MKKSNAIVLCSGGIDSVTTAFLARGKYSKIKILFFDYGQKTIEQEERCSRACAKEIGAEFIKVKLDFLSEISGSLINKEGLVKKIKRKELRDTSKESEKYYVPCRNSVFLVNALALAESLYIKKKEANDILVGFKCEGKESYPDTTKEFVEEMNKLSKISCSRKFRIIAPLIDKDKEDIISLGKKLGVDFRNTYSCYIGKNEHCGYCLACMLRKDGFYWANVKDETDYSE